MVIFNKVYELNKQVYKCVCVSVYVCMVMFFSSNTRIVSLVLTGCVFVLPWMHFMCLALLDNSSSDYTWHGQCCVVLKSHIPASGIVIL